MAKPLKREPIYGPLRWLITLTVMLVAIIEVLDMTIVNVTLPHMMGSLGANSDQITWVLTSYIVSAAIFMPLTGFLVTRYGTKNILLMNIVGFLISSMCCGLANSLDFMILFRTTQGIFGAALVPISQYVLRDIFSNEEQGKAMAIWGMGIMVAPVLGPMLGGYITEHLSWRWVFYINFPVCLLALIMTMRYMYDTEKQNQYIDWIGMGLMAVGIGSLQIFLDQGNTEGWFDSNFILILCVIFTLSLSLFIIRGILIKEKNIINLMLFKDRNFAMSTLAMLFFGMGLFGTLTLIPIELERLMNYPVLLAGILSSPQGIMSAITMMFVGPLITKVDPRKIIAVGVFITACGAFMYSRFSLQTDMQVSVIIPAIIMGMGMGMFFIPLAAIALISLPPSDTAEASGVFSFSRNLGSSMGISILTTILSHETQISWHDYVKNISVYNPNFHLWLHRAHLTLANPKTTVILVNTLMRQSNLNAFNDAYWFVTLVFLGMLPLLLLIPRPLFKGEANVSFH